MKCQILSSGKDKKNMINLSSVEFDKRLVKGETDFSQVPCYI